MSRRLSRQVPDAEERLHILKTVHRNATLAGVDPELVLAVMDVESNFDRFAIFSSPNRATMSAPDVPGFTSLSMWRILPSGAM